MYLGVGKIFVFEELSYNYKLVVQLKERFKGVETSNPFSLMEIFKS